MSTSISSEEKSLSFENPSVEGTEEQEEDAGGQKMPLKELPEYLPLQIVSSQLKQEI